MNSITKLSRGYIIHNRTQCLLVTLSIILTTCLLTTIGITSVSIQKKLQSDIIRRVGSAHGRYNGISPKQLEILKNNQKLKAVGEQLIVGTVKTQGADKLNAYMIYLDTNAGEMSNKTLNEGIFPMESNEIAAERWVFEELGIEAKIGGEVRLKYTNFLKGNLEVEENVFIISGILKDNEFLKTAGQAELMVSKEFAFKGINTESLKYNVLFRVADRNDVASTLYEVANNIGIKSESLGINTEYLNTLKPDLQVVISAGVIALVVILASIIVIYNIFNISIASRINQLGLLAAIGITRKQLKSLIAKEGRLLSIVGIPVGLILGYIISHIIVRNIIIENNALEIKANSYIILFSGLVSFFTIMISLRKPGKIASKISPIEATRYNSTETYGKKTLRKGFKEINIKKLAYASLLRNKRRTVMTILSLTISGVLFIIFSTILSSMNVDNLVEQYIKTDFQLSLNYQRDNSKSNPLNQELIDGIMAIPGVTDVSVIKHTQVYMPNSTNIKLPDDKSITMKELNCDFYGFGIEMLEQSRKYLVDGEISISNLNENNQVLLVWDKQNKSPYAVGDKMILTVKNNGTEYEKEFLITGIINENLGWLGFRGMGPTFISHEETFIRELGVDTIKRIRINSEKDDYEGVNSRLKILATENNVTFESRRDYKTSREEEIRGIRIMAMSLVFIIGIIGLMNLINTMATGILSRKKEIGTLQAVGMTDKQVIRVLQLEGLYYAAISLILSITTGSFLGSVFYNAFKQSATYAQYKYPAFAVLLLIVVFISVQILVTYLIIKNLNRSSVVDRIRYSE